MVANVDSLGLACLRRDLSILTVVLLRPFGVAVACAFQPSGMRRFAVAFARRPEDISCRPKMPPLRTLIVEDHEELRNFLRLTLQNEARCVVIGEAVDGMQAIQKAEELQPDLILLDLSLPKINGMEALRRIRKRSPNSKLVILSQDSSPDVVQGALSLGAVGYLLKSDANNLPMVLDAVVQGTVFVSPRLKSS
jgi:CheY-like chemotaxis protein